MDRFTKKAALGFLVGTAAFGLAVSPAYAQFGRARGGVVGNAFIGPANAGQPLPGIQPFFRVAPGLTLPQAAYNTTMMGMAYQNFPASAMPFAPAYALGYSPRMWQGPVAPNLPPNSMFTYNSPYGVSSPYTSGGGSASMTSTGSSPYGGYGGYGGYGNYPYGYPYVDPLGGYMRGAADVVRGQANYLVSTQQANLVKEQVRRERLENRRKALDEWLYEREKTPTAEDERERAQAALLRRARNSPPASEIYSGQALNTLLNSLEKRPTTNVAGTAYPLDRDTLAHVNVVPSGATGNPAFLKDGGKLSWPLALDTDEFRDEREQLNALLPDAVKQAKNEGHVGATTLRDITAALDRMERALRNNIKDLPPADHMEARRFLGSLEDAVRVLRSPDVGRYFNGDYAPRAQNVPELVQNMKDKGLVFAPALGGDEAAYASLYQSLAAYDAAVETQLAAQTAK